MIKTASMTPTPDIVRAAITLPQVTTRQVVLTALQIPTYPVSPPAGAQNLGKISWDQPEMIKYDPPAEVSALAAGATAPVAFSVNMPTLSIPSDAFHVYLEVKQAGVTLITFVGTEDITVIVTPAINVTQITWA